MEIIPLGATYVNIITEIDKYDRSILIGSYLYDKPNKTVIDGNFLDKLTNITKESKISEIVG